MNLSAEQLQTLRHMLGIDKPYDRDPSPYRDYYCANPGDPQLREMERIGAVLLYSTSGGYEWFRSTSAGRTAAMLSHKSIRKSRGARLYKMFLDVRDCWPELTFKRFLTDPVFRQRRGTA